VRFSSDTLPVVPDAQTSLGIAIKLFGVCGEKALESEKEATTHDFLLQNHEVFFLDTARDMCEYANAALSGEEDRYLREHPNTKRIMEEMKKEVTSVLHATYYSVIPYTFGLDPQPGQHVKYKLKPDSVADSPRTDGTTDDPNYLRHDLRRRLLKGKASFGFYLQLRTDPDKMPLDKATVAWDEVVSEPMLAATLTIPRQEIEERGQAAYGENLAYNPGHALREHLPVGCIAEARMAVYQASAELRRDLNGVPNVEPRKPRPIINS
jgi:hypothetical protein